MRRPHSAIGLLLLATTALSGCLYLTKLAKQELRLFFELDQDLPAGDLTEVYSAIYPEQRVLRKDYVHVYGQITPAGGGALPTAIEVRAVSSDLTTEAVYYQFKLTVSVGPDGSFSAIKKYKKNLLANSLQTVLVRPVGAPVRVGSTVALCVELVDKKSQASSGPCASGGSGGGSAKVVTVAVLNNRFEPPVIRINAGDTVRWELGAGATTNHTVTARGGVFDSGLTLSVAGASFERQFSASENNMTFEYSCVTHLDCCDMQGAVQVGADAPAPDPY